MQGLN